MPNREISISERALVNCREFLIKISAAVGAITSIVVLPLPATASLPPSAKEIDRFIRNAQGWRPHKEFRGAVAAAMINGTRSFDIKKYVKKYWANTGTLPKGKHKVTFIEGMRFENGVHIGQPYQLEVDFPESSA